MISSSRDYAIKHKGTEDNDTTNTVNCSINILPAFVFATESENTPVSLSCLASVASLVPRCVHGRERAPGTELSYDGIGRRWMSDGRAAEGRGERQRRGEWRQRYNLRSAGLSVRLTGA